MGKSKTPVPKNKLGKLLRAEELLRKHNKALGVRTGRSVQAATLLSEVVEEMEIEQSQWEEEEWDGPV